MYIIYLINDILDIELNSVFFIKSFLILIRTFITFYLRFIIFN